MSGAQGFTIWLAGGAARDAAAFASELRARLTRRGHRVRLWTSEEAGEVVVEPHGVVINIVPEGSLESAARERLRGALPNAVEVLLGRAGEADASVGTGHEPGEPAVEKLALAGGEGSLEEAVSLLLSLLESRKLIPGTDDDTRRDEQLLIERLTELGYL